ncbi:MAG: VTT domain-containing protein [Patescibacteria group bacterium]
MTLLEDFVLTNQFLSYLIVFGGMFIEGEIFFITASLFVLQGYLNFWVLAAVVFAGMVLGDIAWYYLGYYSKDSRLGRWLTAKFPHYEKWLNQNFISRYSRMAFFSKFLYYVNRLTPLIAGWNKMEFKKFFRIHIAAAALWLLIMALVVNLLGFVAVAIGIREVLKRIEWIVIGLIIVVFAGEYLLKFLFSKKIKI